MVHKKIIVTGVFQGSKDNIKWAFTYCEKLLTNLSMKGFKIDVLDLSPIKRKLNLPENCSHIYLGSSFFQVWSKPAYNKILDKLNWQHIKLTNIIQLTIGSLIYISRYIDYISKNTPSLIIHYNGKLTTQRILHYIGLIRGIPQLLFQAGNIPGTVEFDSIGNQALSWPVHNFIQFHNLEITPSELENTKKYLEHIKNKRSANIDLESEQIKYIKEKSLSENKKIIFLAGSGQYGNGLWPRFLPESFSHSPFYYNDTAVLNDLLKLTKTNNWLIIYKSHPINPKVKAINHPNLIYIKDLKSKNEIFNCIDIADVVLTLVSSVSGLALLYNRPVVLLGRNGLTGMKITYELRKKENLENIIRTALEHGFNSTIAEECVKYATRIMKYYSYLLNEKESPYLTNHLEKACNFLIHTCN